MICKSIFLLGNKFSIKNHLSIYLITLLLLSALACDKESIADNDLDDCHEYVIYSNYFENSEAVSDFKGYLLLNDDTPANGGDSSGYISGGCVVPHVLLELGPFENEQTIFMRFWGKTITSGQVNLLLDKDYLSGLNFVFQDTIWTFYEPKDSLFCPANKLIQLELSSGGFFPGGMNIDNFELFTKVN